MSTTPLPLSLLCNLVVQITPQGAQVPTFNQALIVGTSAAIPSVGANSRLRVYLAQTWATQMITDGFSSNSPEYIAAGIYFSQKASGPAPLYLAVGRQDLTAIFSAIPHVGNAGAGYVVGDIIEVTQGGANAGFLRVTTIGGGGAVTGLATIVGQQGTGYSVAASLATTGGSGAGLEVDITAIGESCVEALAACRIASGAWYLACVLDAVTADHEACALYAQTASPAIAYFGTTSDAAVLAGTPGNLLATLKAANYGRVWIHYATTQGEVYPNQIYAAVADMGVAMGLNTGLANSYFTMKFKSLVGIVVEPLSYSQVQVIEGNNGNLYLNYNNSYAFLEQGTMANGQFFDEVLGIDMLAADAQVEVVNAFAENAAIPLTDSGQSIPLGAVTKACENSANRGFIRGGTWNGPQVLNLTDGTVLPNGYLCQSPPYSQQTPQNRAARIGQPVYASVIEGESMHSITVGLYVQR